MKTLRIQLGQSIGRQQVYAGCSIVLARTVIFNDYRSKYGGAELGLLGMLAGTHLALKERLSSLSIPSIKIRDGRDRTRRLAELAESFLSYPGAYCAPEEIPLLLAAAQLDPRSEPIAFYSVCEHRKGFETFMDRVEREGFIGRERISFTASRASAPPPWLAGFAALA